MRLLSDNEIRALLLSYAKDNGIAVSPAEGLAGLGDLDGFLSKLWSGVKKIAGPVLGIAAAFIPGIGPGLSLALKATSVVASTAQAHHDAVNQLQDQQAAVASFTLAQQSAFVPAVQQAVQSPDIASTLVSMGVNPNDPRIQTVVQQAALRQSQGVTTVQDNTPWLIIGGIAALAFVLSMG